MPDTSDDVEISLEDIFPDASSLLQAHSRSVEDMQEECMVVLDTNVLLVPYVIAPHSLDEVRRTYRQLLEGERLFIPARVVREFVRNRARKLEEMHQQLTKRRSQQRSFASGRYVLLETCEPYSEMLGLERSINEQLEKHKELAARVIEHVRSWSWSDPVSEMYRELFGPSLLIEPDEGAEDVKKELRRRYQHQIPPGYKDAAKPDGGIGDLIVWLSILALGRKHKRDVLFITGEEKSDWWHRSDGQALYPRFELVEEYWRASGGRGFQIAKLSTLLSLRGSETSIVTEVRAGEIQTTSEDTVPPSTLRLRQRISFAVWLRKTLEAESIKRVAPGRFEIIDTDGDRVSAVEVRLSVEMDDDAARIAIQIAVLEQEKVLLSGMATLAAVVVVGDDEASAQRLWDLGIPLTENSEDGLRFYVGFYKGMTFRAVGGT